MKCETLFVGPGVTAIVCSRNAPRKRCGCGELTDLLCDYPVGEKGTPKPPKVGDARTNIHNRKVFYVWSVQHDPSVVVVHTRTPTLQMIPRGALEMPWTAWFERTRPGCDRPVCRRCVTRLGTLDICATHARELAKAAK